MTHSLISNIVYNILYKLVNVLYPLITISYVSRIIFAEGVGKVAETQNISMYFVLLAALGIPVYGIKAIANSRSDISQLNKTFTSIFLLNMISTLLSVVIYYYFACFTDLFNKEFRLIAVFGFSIVLNFANVDWYFEGLEEYRYILVRNVIVKMISLIAILLLVCDESDYFLYAIILIFGQGLNNIFNLIMICKKVRITFDFDEVVRHIRPIFVLFSATLAIEVYTLADTTMLSSMSNSSIVGYYVNSVRCIGIVKMVILATCSVFLPRLSYYSACGDVLKFNKLTFDGIYLLLFLSIPAAAFVFALSDVIIPLLFGADFISAVPTVRILAFSIISVALSNYIGYQVMISLNKEKVVFFSTLCGAVVNVLLNIFLIPLFFHNGAALASVCTEFLVTLIQVIILSRVMLESFNVKRVFLLVLSSLISFLFVIIYRSLFTFSPLFDLLISFVLGLTIYIYAVYRFDKVLIVGYFSVIYNKLCNKYEKV